MADEIQPDGVLGGGGFASRLPFRLNELFLMVAIVVVIGLVAAADSQHTYFNSPLSSARDILRNTVYLGIFALGATVVIIAGGIDLSAGSTIAFSGAICATIMVLLAPQEMKNATPLPFWVCAVAILGTLLVGLLIGTLHAWLITSVGLPPFIATLATLVGLRSLGRAMVENVTALVWTAKSTQIPIFDDGFRFLATSVWIPIAIFVVLALAVWMLLSMTVTGRHIYALGGNEQAARLSGIQTDGVKWLAYCISSITASIAGILYICDQATADPQTLGRGYELNAIAAAVVGGCSLQGGVGTVLGTILGALFLRIVIDGVSKIIKAGADVYEGLIVGVVVVIAVAFSQLRQVLVAGHESFPGWLGGVSIVALSLVLAGIAALAGGQLGGGATGAIAGGSTLVVSLLCMFGVKILQSQSRK